MPQAFRFQDVLVDFWLPLRLLPEPGGGLVRPLRVIARLEAGVTRAQAQAALDAMSAPLAAQSSNRQGWRAELQGLDEALYGWARQPLLTLQIAVGLVFVIACANVAGLLLARGATRRREINLRIALGAGRPRIARQLLTESLLLSVAGGVLGIVVAWLGLRGLSAMTPALASPSLGPLTLDTRVLAITVALSVFSVAGFGLIPAFAASQVDPIEIVRVGAAGRATAGSNRSHGVIVAAQFAVALMLMIGAGLLVKSSLRLAGRDLHFEPDGVLMFDWSLPVQQRPLGTYRGSSYFEIVTPPAPVYTRLLDRLRDINGIESAGASSYPAVNSLIIPTVDVELDGAGTASGSGRTVRDVAYFLVTPGFFETIRAPVVSGRAATDHDTTTSPWVLVVNEAAARSFWPGQDPVGRRVLLDTVPEERVREVTGVVRDIPLRHGDTVPRPVVYASYLQQPARWRAPMRTLFGNMTFVLRTKGDPAAVLPAVRRTAADIDPDRPLAAVGTVRQHLDAAMRQFRYVVFLVTLLACTAGTLAIIGVYGTVAYTAAQRIHDIGVRKALGADRWQIAALVGKGALGTIAAGLASGLGGALILARLIASQLWGIAPTDPATYLAVSLVLFATAAAACFGPVRRAITVDPAAAIRCE